ncbi:hypothetical protein AVEN_192978-1 [Araneus ventricosus]|uniref:Uncharacterized protein n=1 Tax=Araneus ventricosus TaxID=182803 RepID=A0A4Y2PLK9_ARAVE|nr:hypothetical protein AVEN_192978-1 [Araneus ventricosus]
MSPLHGGQTDHLSRSPRGNDTRGASEIGTETTNGRFDPVLAEGPLLERVPVMDRCILLSVRSTSISYTDPQCFPKLALSYHRLLNSHSSPNFHERVEPQSILTVSNFDVVKLRIAH